MNDDDGSSPSTLSTATLRDKLKSVRAHLAFWCSVLISLYLVVDLPLWLRPASTTIGAILLLIFLIIYAPDLFNRVRERADRMVWPMLLIGTAIGIYVVSTLLLDDNPIAAVWWTFAAIITGFSGVAVAIFVLSNRKEDQE